MDLQDDLPAFEKYPDGLVPAIVQDANTLTVLMLGFMNEEAWKATGELGLITFWSRSKGRLWTKGEESGNHLTVTRMRLDCDLDTILIQAIPAGPVCHTGDDTCFADENKIGVTFLNRLEETIHERRTGGDSDSYVAQLFGKGINKIAQKVGEEAVEMVIESKDVNRALFLGEAADLMFHYLVLLQAKDCRLQDVIEILQQRHKTKTHESVS